MEKLKWEPIAWYNEYVTTARLKVFKGWLVRCLGDDEGESDCMSFVPDENHDWKL